MQTGDIKKITENSQNGQNINQILKKKTPKNFESQEVDIYKGIYESTETSMIFFFKKSLKLTGDQGRSSQ